MNTNNNDNRFTTVKTVYARAAIVLLALNFCLTGYVITNMNEITQELIDSKASATSVETQVIAKTQD